MPSVRIPQPMQCYTGGKELVTINGKNVRQLINELDRKYPGMKQALMDDDSLKPDVAVAIDGQVTQMGLLQPLTENNEVIFIPAIGGG